MPRRIVVYALTSLDGAVEHPGRYFPETTDAGAPVFDEVMARLETELIARQDAVLLGRTTYDEWAGYWPTAAEKHPAEQPFADFINKVPKHVVTSRPLDTSWTNATAVGAPIGEVVRSLRAEGGADVGVHGSIRLAQSLLAAGLVDGLELAVGRVLDPDGRRLLDAIPEFRVLQLERVVPSPTGAVWLSYSIPQGMT